MKFLLLDPFSQCVRILICLKYFWKSNRKNRIKMPLYNIICETKSAKIKNFEIQFLSKKWPTFFEILRLFEINFSNYAKIFQLNVSVFE